MASGFWAGIQREIRYLCREKWDLALVLLAPACILILLGSMFAKGKPDHLPVAIIDQDQSSLSSKIYDMGKFMFKKKQIKLIGISNINLHKVIGVELTTFYRFIINYIII